MLNGDMIRRLSDTAVNLGSMCVVKHAFSMMEEDRDATIEDLVDLIGREGMDEEFEIGIETLLRIVEGDYLFSADMKRQEKTVEKILRIVNDTQYRSWESAIEQIGNITLTDFEQGNFDNSKIDDAEILEMGVKRVMNVIKDYSAYMDKLIEKFTVAK